MRYNNIFYPHLPVHITLDQKSQETKTRYNGKSSKEGILKVEYKHHAQAQIKLKKHKGFFGNSSHWISQGPQSWWFYAAKHLLSIWTEEELDFCA